MKTGRKLKAYYFY